MSRLKRETAHFYSRSKEVKKRFRRWLIWSKRSNNNSIYKVLVLIGLVNSPTFNYTLLPEEMPRFTIQRARRKWFAMKTVSFVEEVHSKGGCFGKRFDIYRSGFDMLWSCHEVDCVCRSMVTSHLWQSTIWQANSQKVKAVPKDQPSKVNIPKRRSLYEFTDSCALSRYFLLLLWNAIVQWKE